MTPSNESADPNKKSCVGPVMATRFSQETAMQVCNEKADWGSNQESNSARQGQAQQGTRAGTAHLLCNLGKEQARQAMLTFISQ